MSQQDERRKALISKLAANLRELGDSEISKVAKDVGVPLGTIRKDLDALAAGTIPPGDVEVSAEAHALAGRVKTAKADAEVDAVMGDLAALLLDGLVPVPEAKAAQSILVGRRYFFAAIEAARIAAQAQVSAGKGGKTIKVHQTPAVMPSMPPAQLMGGADA